MHVDDHLVLFQEADAVGGRLVASGNTAFRDEVERHLVAGGAQRGDRDAAPGTGDRPMQVTEEHVPDVGPPLDRLDEVLRLEQRDVVHPLQPHLEGRVMDEDHHRGGPEAIERCLEPGRALLAEGAPRLAGLVGVEADGRDALAHVERVLDEAVLVEFGLRECRVEIGAVVVIADQQVVGDHELVELALQRRIGLRLALVREIARQDREGRIRVIAVHVGDAERQPVDRIEAVEQVARWHEMGVGEVNELLHGSDNTTVITSKARDHMIRGSFAPREGVLDTPGMSRFQRVTSAEAPAYPSSSSSTPRRAWRCRSRRSAGGP